MIQISEDEYDGLLLAQVQQEEFDDYAEQSAFRYAQQQSLIEDLQQEVASHENDQDEIDRLKRDAKANEARRAAVREKLLARKETKGESESDDK
jgi:hypothetical protein